MKSLAIVIHKTGGPEVLSFEEREVKAPGAGEVMIRNHAIGVNFIDTYFRSGLYQTELPAPLGFEGAGVVEEVGAGVTHVKKGDRVAYAQGPLGAYSQLRTMTAQQVVKIPDGVSFEQAASVMLKGLTVSYLYQDTYQLKRDEVFLFHAAAGGTGLIACQWAKHIGAKMIGTVSSDEKAAVAKKNGATWTVNYTKEDVVKRVNEITEGKKLHVVYDGVGKSTWTQSLDCLAPRGLMVSFGNASGAVTGVALSELASRGSLYVTRPMLNAYTNTLEKLTQSSAQLFDLVARGVIDPGVSEKIPLKDARHAHEALLDRNRVGPLLLIP
ncbi:MAG: quinone oxidoreductase family protein [Bacteriovoracaceae bacterium]